MKNPDKSVLATAITLREKGRNHKEIMAETGLSHSQMERHFMAADIKSAVIEGGFQGDFPSETAKTSWIAAKRLAGESWGLISVRLGEPESRTRKSFEDSGMRSKGLRIGKGGRFVQNEQAFYTGTDRAKLGSELTKQAPISAQVPTDFDTPQVRVLPKVAKAGKATKRVAKKA